jgi:hypothetical protein
MQTGNRIQFPGTYMGEGGERVFPEKIGPCEFFFDR